MTAWISTINLRDTILDARSSEGPSSAIGHRPLIIERFGSSRGEACDPAVTGTASDVSAAYPPLTFGFAQARGVRDYIDVHICIQ